MVRGGRVPDYQVALSYLRGKKDHVKLKHLYEYIVEVNCNKKTRKKKQHKIKTANSKRKIDTMKKIVCGKLSFYL